jgi:hypothetical protein
MTIICAVSATKTESNVLISEGIDYEGTIMIVKVSDVDYIFQYQEKKSSKTIMRITDLDNLEIEDDSKKCLRANFSLDHLLKDFQNYNVEDDNQYDAFKEALFECRMLSEMTFRMNSLARDVYFAGIYSSELSDTDDILLSEELQRMREQQSSSSRFTIFSNPSDTWLDEGSDSDNDLPEISPSLSPSKQHHSISEINCVFCGVQKIMEFHKDFAVHPYVPATFDNKNIYMCIPCLRNWKEFRDKAARENQLVLKDEVNEELCGMQ